MKFSQKKYRDGLIEKNASERENKKKTAFSAAYATTTRALAVFTAVVSAAFFLLPLAACGAKNDRADDGGDAPVESGTDESARESVSDGDGVLPPDDLPSDESEENGNADLSPDNAENDTDGGNGNDGGESSDENNENDENGGTGNDENTGDGTGDGAQTPAISTISYIQCTGENVNLRSGPGTGYAAVGVAEKGTVYAINGKTDGWYKTYYRNATVYVNAAYTKTIHLEKSDNALVENVIWEAGKTIGVPYVYGAVRLHDGAGNLLAGFTAMKFDCSSLVQYAFYYGAGVLLDTTTRLQVVQGQKVEKSRLSRGDCIYFTNASREHYTGIERVGHVAVYLGGNYILHTSSDYARIEEMTSQRWAYYIEARRFV